MAPTTHAAVGAAIAHLCPRLRLAVPLAFASHFLLDSIFHFEAFYPLSQVLGTTHDEAFWITALVMAAILVPSMAWIGRESHDVRIVALYTVATSAALLVDEPIYRLVALVCLTLGGVVIEPHPERRGVARRRLHGRPPRRAETSARAIWPLPYVYAL